MDDSLGVAFLGHVDAGKSTIAGHLMYQVGCIPDRELQLLEREATALGKGSFKYAFYLDRTREERERGISVTMTVKSFRTTKFNCAIIDTPGYSTYFKETIKGISLSDIVILVVSAAKGEFEASVADRLYSYPFKDRAITASAFGVKQLIVAVNKMDAFNIGYSRDRFQEVQQEVSKYIKRIGYDPQTVPFIPISGWSGDNLVTKSPNMPWWEGPTLLEAIDSMQSPKKLIDLPLRFLISNVYRITGINGGTVIAGRVISGIIKPGMIISISPGNFTGTTVFTIEKFHVPIEEAIPGDIVGVCIKDCSFFYSQIKSGFLAGDASQDPPQEANKLIVQLVVIYHPREIRAGYTPVFDCHSAHVPCKWTNIISKIDKKTFEVLEENPTSIKPGDSAIVEMVPMKPICVESFEDNPRLGRFTIRDSRRTIAIGIIKHVEKKNKQGQMTKAVRV